MYFSQIFDNMMNMGNKMNSTGKLITSSDLNFVGD